MSEAQVIAQQRARTIDNKMTAIVVLGVVIVILAAIAAGFIGATWKVLTEIQQLQCLDCATAQENFVCNDFNPCTIDVVNPIACPVPQARTSTCASFGCTHVNLSDGACCNQYDFCYNDDPLKMCFDGVCRSPNPMNCKGFCVDDGYCFDNRPPIEVGSECISWTCLFNSCVTQICVNVPIADPMIMFQTNTLAQLNESSCYEAVCVNDYFDNLTFCSYQWKCAPFIAPIPPTEEPTEESGKRYAAETTASPTSAPTGMPTSSGIPLITSYMGKPVKQVPLHGLYGNNYKNAQFQILDFVVSHHYGESINLAAISSK